MHKAYAFIKGIVHQFFFVELLIVRKNVFALQKLTKPNVQSYNSIIIQPILLIFCKDSI